MYFLSHSTVIPSFMSKLTNQSWLIGLVAQFESIGWYLPQLFASAFMVHRSRKMPIYRLSFVMRTIMLFAIAAITLVNPNPSLLLAFFVTSYVIFVMSAGLGGVVFMEFVAKAIPVNRRGRFLGLRLSISGVLTATIGAITISALLSSSPFPTNFGRVFLCGAVFASIGLLLMAIMREPRTIAPPDQRTIKEHVTRAFSLLKADKRFRAYLELRLLIGCWTIGVPFLILFAHDKLGFDTGDIGIFVASECVGLVVGNFFWERLADRKSPKIVLEIVTIVCITLPLVIFAYQLFALPAILFAVVFAISAAVDAGATIGGISYLIDIAPERERTTYIGLFNSLMALPCLLTALAGLLLDWAGFTALYGLVLAISVASFFSVRKLHEIPHRTAHLAT